MSVGLPVHLELWLVHVTAVILREDCLRNAGKDPKISHAICSVTASKLRPHVDGHASMLISP